MIGRPPLRAETAGVQQLMALVMLVAVTVITSGHVHTHDHAAALPHGHAATASDLHATSHHEGSPAVSSAVGTAGAGFTTGPGAGLEAGPATDGHRDGAHAEVGVRAQPASLLAAAPGTTVEQPQQTHATAALPVVPRSARTPVSERAVIRT